MFLDFVWEVPKNSVLVELERVLVGIKTPVVEEMVASCEFQVSY